MQVGNLGQRVIVANWKMNHTRQQAENFMQDFSERMQAWYEQKASAIGSVQIVICPPYTALSAVHPYLPRIGGFLGAQNVHWQERGAFTGDIAADMLLELGCTHVILGHSERRKYAAESDQEIAMRLETALRHGLQPILCVGENLEQRMAGQAETVVGEQLEIVLDRVRKELLGRDMMIAYEPVWAIGSGQPATPHDVREMARSIRRHWQRILDGAASCRILYGGSVRAENIAGFLTIGEMDGALVGGDSLQADSFFRIVQAAAEAT